MLLLQTLMENAEQSWLNKRAEADQNIPKLLEGSDNISDDGWPSTLLHKRRNINARHRICLIYYDIIEQHIIEENMQSILMLRRNFPTFFYLIWQQLFYILVCIFIFCIPNLGNLDNFSYGLRKWQEICTGQPRPGKRAACLFEGNCILRKCVKASWFRNMSSPCPHMVLAGFQTGWRIQFCRCRKNFTGNVAGVSFHLLQHVIFILRHYQA